MRSRWRLIVSAPSDPFTNMALDETLLRSYSLYDSGPTLRIYGWRPAAFSLGYSQDPRRELDLEACGRSGIRFVRRITGGGIIRHEHELTYSLVATKEDLGIPEEITSSYKIISSFLIALYRRLGLEASYACDGAPGEKFGAVSALCFAAKEKYDIVVGGKKIGGSAQKRSRDMIFQHGSIPLGGVSTGGLEFLRDRSAAERSAAQATGLAALLGRQAGIDELSGLLVESFEDTFGVALEPHGLSAREEALMNDLRTRKYESRGWNFDRVDATITKNGHDGYVPTAALVGQ